MSEIIALLEKAKEICCVAPGDAVDKITQAIAKLRDMPSENIQTIVGIWAEKQFDQSTNASICEHLRREIVELTESHSKKEAADCLLCLLHFAYKNEFDLLAEALKKHEINTKRNWGKPDEQGVVEHIEPPPCSTEIDTTPWYKKLKPLSPDCKKGDK